MRRNDSRSPGVPASWSRALAVRRRAETKQRRSRQGLRDARSDPGLARGLFSPGTMRPPRIERLEEAVPYGCRGLSGRRLLSSAEQIVESTLPSKRRICSGNRTSETPTASIVMPRSSCSAWTSCRVSGAAELTERDLRDHTRECKSRVSPRRSILEVSSRIAPRSSEPSFPTSDSQDPGHHSSSSRIKCPVNQRLHKR